MELFIAILAAVGSYLVLEEKENFVIIKILCSFIFVLSIVIIFSFIFS